LAKTFIVDYANTDKGVKMMRKIGASVQRKLLNMSNVYTCCSWTHGTWQI